jgi:hypothetical protein
VYPEYILNENLPGMIYITQSFGKIEWSRSIILKAYYANGTIMLKFFAFE